MLYVFGRFCYSTLFVFNNWDGYKVTGRTPETYTGFKTIKLERIYEKKESVADSFFIDEGSALLFY